MREPGGREGDGSAEQKRRQEEAVVLDQILVRLGDDPVRVWHPGRLERGKKGHHGETQAAEHQRGQDDPTRLPKCRLRSSDPSTLSEEVEEQPGGDEDNKEKYGEPGGRNHRVLPVEVGGCRVLRRRCRCGRGRHFHRNGRRHLEGVQGLADHSLDQVCHVGNVNGGIHLELMHQ